MPRRAIGDRLRGFMEKPEKKQLFIATHRLNPTNAQIEEFYKAMRACAAYTEFFFRKEGEARLAFARAKALDDTLTQKDYADRFDPWREESALKQRRHVPECEGVKAQYVNGIIQNAKKQMGTYKKSAKTKGEKASIVKFCFNMADRYSVHGEYSPLREVDGKLCGIESTKNPGEFITVKERTRRSLRSIALTDQAQITHLGGRRYKIGSLEIKSSEGREWSQQASGYVSIIRDDKGLGQWFVRFTTEQRRSQPLPPVPGYEGRTVGVDLGVSRTFAWNKETKSYDVGKKINEWISVSEPVINGGHHKMTPEWMAKKVDKMDTLRSERDQYPRGSDAYREFSRRLRRVGASLEAARKCEANAVARQVARRFQFVAVEDLDHKQMRTSKKLGRETKRALATHALAETRDAFKAAFTRAHGEDSYKAVPPQYTSRTCSTCFTVNEAGQRREGKLFCKGCGAVHHDDENAAKIIRDAVVLAGSPQLAEFEARQAAFRPGVEVETEEPAQTLSAA